MNFIRHRIAVSALVFIPVFLLSPAPTLCQSSSSEGARKVVARVAPIYPSLASSMHLQGTVKADVLVAPDGTAKGVEIKGGHPLLVQSAQNALRQWKWEPAPRESHVIIELKFTP